MSGQYGPWSTRTRPHSHGAKRGDGDGLRRITEMTVEVRSTRQEPKDAGRGTPVQSRSSNGRPRPPARPGAARRGKFRWACPPAWGPQWTHDAQDFGRPFVGGFDAPGPPLHGLCPARMLICTAGPPPLRAPGGCIPSSARSALGHTAGPRGTGPPSTETPSGGLSGSDWTGATPRRGESASRSGDHRSTVAVGLQAAQASASLGPFPSGRRAR